MEIKSIIFVYPNAIMHWRMILKRNKQFIAFGAIFGVFAAGLFTVLLVPLTRAQLNANSSSTSSSSLSSSTSAADLQQKQGDKTQLEQQLAQIQQEIAQYENQLAGIKSDKNTLANKIKQLKAQQGQINLQIQQTNLNIKQIEQDMDETQNKIADNKQRQQILQGEIAYVLRQIYDKDQAWPALNALLSGEGFSGLYTEINDQIKTSQGLASVLQQLRDRAAELRQYNLDLANRQDQQENLIRVANLQKQELGNSIGDQNNLLQITKGREADYQVVLSDTKRRAAEIQNRLYDLLGVSHDITFGQAVTIAQWASQLTGVRAAFILAILTQESNIGKNVGTCNRPDDPPEKSWKAVMKPERDQQPFLQITSELALDPDATPVSCPMRDKNGKQIGWGGAMGPAQFIPSTWMGYRDKVSAITGKSANPWDIRDAFLAAAIKLAAGGATTQNGEWDAAMRYFSGSINAKFRFYGDNVVAQANRYQGDIDVLSQSQK